MAIIFLGSYVPTGINHRLDSIIGSNDPAANTLQNSLITGFEKLGNTVKIISYKNLSTIEYHKNKDFLEELVFENIIIRIEAKSILKDSFKEYNFFVKSLKKVVQDTDVIVVYSLTVGKLLALTHFLRQYHNKVVQIITDLPLYMSNRTDLIYKILKNGADLVIRQCLKRITNYVVLSRYMSEYLPKNSNNKVVVVEGIYNEPKIDYYDYGLEDKSYIIYAGTLDSRYGVLTLLNAFVQLNQDKYKLVVCGRGNSENFIKELAAKDPRLCFLGAIPHSHVLSLLSRAKLLINPRTPEGVFTKYSFPSKTMEYFGSGVATVMYRLPGIDDEYYKYCITVESSGIEPLKDVIYKTLSLSKDKLDNIGMDAKRFIIEQKNAIVQCEKICKLLQ